MKTTNALPSAYDANQNLKREQQTLTLKYAHTVTKLLGEIVCLAKSRSMRRHLAIGRVFWQKLGVQAINLSP